MQNMKFFNNDEGVSPIVATLVLIVVAIVGAAAVGLIMGSFSNSVSNQANSNNVASQSSTTITIAGSTTVYPASVLLAKDYMGNHSGVKVTVQQGGSAAGIAAAGMGIADIGASSAPLAASDLQKYPNLQSFEVGGSAVVVLINGALPTNTLTTDDLKNIYMNGNCANLTPTMVIQRSDASGTEKDFAKYLGNPQGDYLDACMANYSATADAEQGNEGVYAKLIATSGAIAFVDLGYAQNLPTGVHILPIQDKTTGTVYSTVDKTHVLAQLKNPALTTSTGYVPGLIKHLFYITNGAPTPVVKDYITFAQSPAGAADFDAAGMFGVTEFA